MIRTIMKALRPLFATIGAILVVHIAMEFLKDVPHTNAVHMVCLTRNPQQPRASGSLGVWYAGDKKFTLPSRWCDPVQKHITIYGGEPSIFAPKSLAHFAVTYRPLTELPSTYKVIEDETAYFLGNWCDFSPENFLQFTKQIYFPLYWLIKSTDQLYKGAKNVVFYPFIYAVCHSGQYFYHDIDRYKYFKDILHVTNKLEVTAHMDHPEPHGICYKKAVFSSELFLDKAAEAIDYFKGTLQISNDTCDPNILVIVDRARNRRILNIDELKKVGESLGYDVRVTVMETLTLKEQAQLVHCTSVLAGVTGAGLQWAFFMKNHSGVVEIAWPHEDWPLFFMGNEVYNSGERDVIRPLNFAKVTDANCRVNPGAMSLYWKELFHTTRNFTEKDATAIVNDKRNYHFWKDGVASLGKMCDAVVNPMAFKNALLSVKNARKQ